MAKKRFFEAALRTAVMLGMVLVFGMVVVGCATNVGRYDRSSPVENDCVIILDGAPLMSEVTKITDFDGKAVDWRAKVGGFPSILGRVGSYQISIPAGKHTLTGWSGQAGLTAGAGTPQTSTTYTFVAGHTYKIKAEGSLQVIDVTK